MNGKKSSVRILVLLFATLTFFSGCGKKEESGKEAETDKTNWKTNIFNEAPFPLPEGAELNERITPWWDADAGELTYVVRSYAEADLEDGRWSVSETAWLVTADLRGNEVKSQVRLPIGGYESAGGGTVCADEAILVLGTPDRKYRLLRYDRETGAADFTNDLNALFPGTVLGIVGAARDSDGNAAVLSQETLLFLSREGTTVRSAALPKEVQGDELLSMKDGTLLARCVKREGDSCYCVYDAGTGGFGEVISGPGSCPMPCGAGFDFCYGVYSNDGASGIYGKNLADEEPVFLLNYMNSGIAGEAHFWFVADADTMVFLARDEQTTHLLNTLPEATPVLYLRGEDMELSNARILHLAYANTGLTTSQTKAVTDFNRIHADCQIVLDDYSEYEDGMNRLAMDMVTGVFKPDILIGYSSSDYILTAAKTRRPTVGIRFPSARTRSSSPAASTTGTKSSPPSLIAWKRGQG